eukprot:2212849-Amphidinium_carterae.1
MDDAVFIEPKVGERQHLSTQVYEAGVRKLLGPAAINSIKNEEEGSFSSRLCVWGLDFDTEQGTITVPERRVLRGAYLLAQPIYDSGNQRITVRDVQRARGTAQSWVAAVPMVKVELAALDLFVYCECDGYAVPNCDVTGHAAAWQSLWQAFEALRFLCTRPEQWGVFFTGDLNLMMPLEERLAMPGQKERTVIVSSDRRTQHPACQLDAAVDWTNKRACQEPVQEFVRFLEHSQPNEEAQVIIAVAELMAVVSFAVSSSDHWRSKVVVAIVDNMNTKYWLQNRSAKNAQARQLLRVLSVMERRHKFSVYAVYVRTYHNFTPDLYSRCSREEFLCDAEKKNLSIVETNVDWQAVMEETQRGSLFLPLVGITRQDQQLAWQLAQARIERKVPRGLMELPQWRPLTTGPHRSWLDGLWTGWGGSVSSPRSFLVILGAADPTGGEVFRQLRQEHDDQCEGVLVVASRSQPLDRCEAFLKNKGWQCLVDEYRSTELGGVVIRDRHALLGCRQTPQSMDALGLKQQ